MNAELLADYLRAVRTQWQELPPEDHRDLFTYTAETLLADHLIADGDRADAS